MLLKEKTKRRVLWFIVGAFTAGALGAGAYFIRDRQLDRRARTDREEGVRLLAQKDYFQAMHKIGPYVRRHPKDAEALYQYAQARQQVVEPDGSQIKQSFAFYRRLLELEPNHQKGAEALLDLYQRVGYDTETKELADRILARDPANPKALRAKAVADFRMRHFAAAAVPAQKLADAAPGELDAEVLLLQIWSKTDAGSAKIRERAEKLRTAHPDDPRFLVVQSVASTLLDDRTAAVDWIRKAIAGDLPDTKSALLAAQQCDGLGMYSDSLAVLQRQAHRHPDADINSAVASRLWEAGEYKKLLELPSSSDDSALAKAMRCMALYAENRLTEAAESMRLLSAAPNNAETHDWGAVIAARFSASNPDPQAIINACQQALKTQPSNPYFHQFLASASAEMGDGEAAVRYWQQAAREAPAWAAPLVDLSGALLRAGRTVDAVTIARAAVDRAPNQVASLMALAFAMASVSPPDPNAVTELEHLTDRIHQLAPNDDRVLVLRVRTALMRNQPPEAISQVRTILQSPHLPSPAILLDLAVISHTARLGLENECFEACDKAHGPTAEVAFARAKVELDNGHAPQALALLERARSGASDRENLNWRIAWARCLDLAGDARAKDAWMALADAQTSDPKVLWMALSARSVQGDRELVGKLLDRIKDQVGDKGITWQLARARWLADGAKSQNDTAQAALLLRGVTQSAPDMLAPRLLLADCLLRLDNVAGAIENLSIAADLQPDAPGISLELARLLQSRGDYQRARQYMDRVSRAKNLSLDDRQRFASLLAADGDARKAQEVLEAAYAGTPSSNAPANLLLASLYRRNGETAKTEAICKRLLEKPDVTSLSFIADFYASQGKLAEAEATLARLDGLQLPPGLKEIARAEYSLRRGQREQAIELLRQATKLAPASEAAWRQLIGGLLDNNQFDDAVATANAAAKAVPNAAGFGLFVRYAPVVKPRIGAAPELVQLLAELPANPSREQVLTDALAAEAPPANAPGTTFTADADAKRVQQVRQLADKQTRVLPLQMLASRLLIEAKQSDEAANIASRAMAAFPNDPAPARMASAALAASARWAETAAAATQWRARAPLTEQLAADQVIAEADFQLGNLAAAKSQLEPHIRAVADQRAGYPELFSQYAKVLIASGERAAGADYLRPLLKSDPAWRLNWMLIAVRNINDNMVSAAWLQEVEPLIPTDAIPEQLILAESWQSLAMRSHDAKHQMTAREKIDRLTALAPSFNQAPMLLSLGVLNENLENLPAAETCYRRALEVDPNLNIARNNLAMLLTNRHSNLDEALALAKQAANSNDPNLASFYDTLAFVQSQRRDFPAAIAAIQQALKLRPNEPVFHLRLATVLVDNHQPERARPVLEQLKSLPNLKNASPDVLQQIQSLQERLGEPKSTTSARAY